MTDAALADPAFAGLADPVRSLNGPEPVTLSAMPLRGRLMLRGGAAARVTAGEALGVALPERAYASARGGEIDVFWLEPDAWLMQFAVESVTEVAATLREALAELPHAVVEVGQRFAGLRLAGARAIDVLGAGCPLDLHPRTFPTGAVTRTLVGKAEVILLRRDDAPGFELLTGRSFAPYLWRYLENAAREFGYRLGN